MILLSFIPLALVLLYTAAFFVAFARDLLRWATDRLRLLPDLRIHSAELILPSRLPMPSQSVPVTSEFLSIWDPTAQQTMTLQCLWNPTLLDATRRRMAEAVEPRHGHRTVLLRVDYSLVDRQPRKLWEFHMRRHHHTVFYRLVGLDDPFSFPPYAPFASEGNAVPKLGTRRSVLALQLYKEGKLAHQFSTDVTARVFRLAGPKHDFFEKSAAGDQLDPSFLFSMLQSDIEALLDRAQGHHYTLANPTAGLVPAALVPEGVDKALAAKVPEVLSLSLRVHSSGRPVRVIDISSFIRQ